MTTHEFKRSQFLPVTVDEAWGYFSDPRNLPDITPPELGFRVVSDVPALVHEGLLIEYRVKPLLGIPFKWVSLIEEVNAPHGFVDKQVKGPYAYWHHRHIFTAAPGGVMMEDIVHYRIPFGQWLPWINKALIVKKLDGIFEFRHKVLIAKFGK